MTESVKSRGGGGSGLEWVKWGREGRNIYVRIKKTIPVMALVNRPETNFLNVVPECDTPSSLVLTGSGAESVQMSVTSMQTLTTDSLQLFMQTERASLHLSTENSSFEVTHSNNKWVG